MAGASSEAPLDVLSLMHSLEGLAHHTLETTPLLRDDRVAVEAEQTVVLQSALAPAVRNGQDVIGFPSRTRLAPAASRGPTAGGRLLALPPALR
jgi:hypothetical protein